MNGHCSLGFSSGGLAVPFKFAEEAPDETCDQPPPVFFEPPPLPIPETKSGPPTPIFFLTSWFRQDFSRFTPAISRYQIQVVRSVRLDGFLTTRPLRTDDFVTFAFRSHKGRGRMWCYPRYTRWV
jgi:hypothetical protein